MAVLFYNKSAAQMFEYFFSLHVVTAGWNDIRIDKNKFAAVFFYGIPVIVLPQNQRTAFVGAVRTAEAGDQD